MRFSYGPYVAPVRTPWADPDHDIRGDIRQSIRTAEEEYARGGRVQVGYVREDIIESDTTPGVFYDMRQRGDGTWSCSCPSYRFGGFLECKHTRRKQEEAG